MLGRVLHSFGNLSFPSRKREETVERPQVLELFAMVVVKQLKHEERFNDDAFYQSQVVSVVEKVVGRHLDLILQIGKDQDKQTFKDDPIAEAIGLYNKQDPFHDVLLKYGDPEAQLNQTSISVQDELINATDELERRIRPLIQLIISYCIKDKDYYANTTAHNILEKHNVR